MMVIFMLCCRLLTIFKTNLLKKTLPGTSVSKGLKPDQDRRFIGPGLGPNYLQRLLRENKSPR